MKLYDPIIEKLKALTGAELGKHYAYNAGKCWGENKEFEMIMQRDTAFELGGGNKPAVHVTCVTTQNSLVDKDQVILVGPDLCEITGDTPYARITLLRTTDIESDDEDDTETAFREIQKMDFVKYHVFPKGFMVRTSSQSNREQVRIGKDAVKAGVSFERIGNLFIRHYKENENVRNATVIFVTAPGVDYDAILKEAKTTASLTASLSRILEGMPTDCGSCGLKDICDEVEGLKELHFGSKNK